jgi:CRISPR-associated protein Csd2
VFQHDSELGNAPAHALFERVQVKRKDGVEVPRSFSDYAVNIAADDLPNGVSLIRPC